MRINDRVTLLLLVGGTAIQLGARALDGQIIHGRLLEQITDKPVGNATVSLIAVPATPVNEARTNGNGEFALRAPAPGIFRLRAVVNGYRVAVSPAIALESGDDVTFVWRIMPDTIYLMPVVITSNKRPNSGRLTGFENRRRTNPAGFFITRDDIDKRRPFRVTDLLMTVPGIRVIPGAFGNDVVTSEGCRPAVYLDGIRFPLMGERIDNIVNPQAIEAIEVYPHPAEVPAEFMSAGQTCGAIAIWTRSGG
jgi:hypothetical protein